MRKLFGLFAVIAVLFASCNLGGNVKVSEKSGTIVPVYDVMSNLIQDEETQNTYKITLSFVGEQPEDCDIAETSFEGSSLKDFEGKVFAVSNILVGTKVQFKLSIEDEGGKLFEGVSDVITVTTETQSVKIKMEKQFSYVPLWYGGESNECYNNWTMKNLLNKKDSYSPFLPDLGHTSSISPYCMDKKGNFYLIGWDDNYTLLLYRYTVASYYFKKEVIADFSVVKYNGQTTDVRELDNALFYDSSNDTLYADFSTSDSFALVKFTGISDIEAGEVPEELEFCAVQQISDDYERVAMAVYGDYVFIAFTTSDGYFVKKYSLSDSAVTGGDPADPDPVYSYEIPEGYFRPKNGELKTAIKDMAVTSDKVLVILNDNKNDDFPYYARGGLIVLDHSLSNANYVGFSTSKYVISMANDDGETETVEEYMPESISQGFFGPVKILAIKEDELIIFDKGNYIEISGSNYNKKKACHLVTVNLKTLTLSSAEEVDDSLVNEISGSLLYSFSDGMNYSGSWEK